MLPMMLLLLMMLLGHRRHHLQQLPHHLQQLSHHLLLSPWHHHLTLLPLLFPRYQLMPRAAAAPPLLLAASVIFPRMSMMMTSRLPSARGVARLIALPRPLLHRKLPPPQLSHLLLLKLLLLRLPLLLAAAGPRRRGHPEWHDADAWCNHANRRS